MTDRKPDFEMTLSLHPAPPVTADKSVQMEWLLVSACTLGRICSDLCRHAGARDNQIALVMHYMAGRTRGAYVSGDDTYGAMAYDAIFHIGIDHGKDAAVEQEMDERATVEGTETTQ